MANLQVIKTLHLGPGTTMNINFDSTQPEDSIDRYIMDTISEGTEGCEPIYVPPHWHKHHAEHISVLEGRMEITIDGKKTLLKAGDPPAFIPIRAVHTFKGFKGEKLVLREKADPAGIYKALFFNDILSQGTFSGFWHIMRAFYDGDAYIALPLNIKLLDEVFLFVVGGIAHLFAPAKPEKL